MDILTHILSLLCGGLVGFSLGFIGGGGSILATPLLLYVVGLEGAHLAIGTSALAVSGNAAYKLLGHARAGNVRWRPALIFAAFGVAGAFAGSTLGKALPGEQLLFLFALLMLVISVYMWLGAEAHEKPHPEDNRKTALIGLGAGAFSGFFGIGGGFLIVPGLIAATGMPILSAIGSSLVSVTAFGLATAINYAFSGFVAWVIAAEFILGGWLGGALGRQLAKRLSLRCGVLNRIFAIIIALVAAYMLCRNS